ncbi:type III-B CRISPR module RAMP protein Cmr4 [Spirulina subsalsa]|uniref:type III-B CRISPR module RAMP protein Cmr4 n=1 Tax=Spirulina subsalsa TaxID=54311 RepID=UPI0002DBC223|nr:type III-B CRISPR module RAMP protein Cmr4 [Spirulina subsalsa]
MATYKRQRYLFMTLDPVHIGTGGYRLGRVDNSIVREPGTKIPKIPGTSLHGAARSYAAQLYETPEAAGQSHNKVTGNIADNPVCYTFGYIKGQDIYSGVVNIFDAHILLFPVHSMVGPVWVSTVERLEEAGFTVEPPQTDWKKEKVLLNWERTDPLNLGWLMLEILPDKVKIEPPKKSKWQDQERYKAIKKIVIVQDALFSQIVNSNLEVRTSVAIDPETGAADEGALFTYEAIPRATFLTAEVVLDDYGSGQEQDENKQNDDKQEENNKPKKRQRPFPKEKKFKSSKNLPGGAWTCPLCVVKAGFRMIEWLGVGGMGTRGFGRMAMIGDPITVGLSDLFDQEKNHD